MMERFLERVSLSRYRENIVLKGGVLIAAMVGIDKRSTMDLDTTIQGLLSNHVEFESIIKEIIGIDACDDVMFEIHGIKRIHDIGEHDDYRISLRARFHTIWVDIKIDFTYSDTMIPSEVEYPYKLMFEDREIPIMAYNIYTILAEKIETVLSRNVTNTRARDYYDIYLLLTLNKDKLSNPEIVHALQTKANERGSSAYIEEYEKHLADIAESAEIASIWEAYCRNYSYARGIVFSDILSLIANVFEY